MTMNGPQRDKKLIERVAAAVHQGWMDVKRADGTQSRVSEWGEEFMVPYPQLSDRAKAIDRATVVSVLCAITEAGYDLIERTPA